MTIQADGRLKVSDLAAGVAGEHLVCADLLMAGYTAFMTDQTCPYDIAVEYDNKLIRIQVKSTQAPKAIPQRVGHNPAYMWSVRRAGKAGRRCYSKDDFDMLALVALDVKKIAYMPPSQHRQTIHIRTHSDRSSSVRKKEVGKIFSDYPFHVALMEIVNAR